jgi:hypothetical protein
MIRMKAGHNHFTRTKTLVTKTTFQIENEVIAQEIIGTLVPVLPAAAGGSSIRFA